ncbi:hypothetical protein KTD31_17430 [Burkholderia multivorans]|uniref:hypothetical protein n=1 Tax=Burkholderia multivorans TaxID=87883 RepID=UPI000B20C41D|nr:hypothetical protein [Burkholderia multivorans]MBU9203141.1 hypothetical protein [Burkholderia multivorans]MCA8385380.1 hypothetical protein [Burkholderia multivorans]
MRHIILYTEDGRTYGSGHYTNDAPDPLPPGEIECTSDQALNWQDFKVEDGALVALSESAVAARINASSLALRQAEARIALDESDRVVLRCYESAIPVPTPWVEYRKQLRAIIAETSLATPITLPLRPDYPSEK